MDGVFQNINHFDSSGCWLLNSHVEVAVFSIADSVLKTHLLYRSINTVLISGLEM